MIDNLEAPDPHLLTTLGLAPKRTIGYAYSRSFE